MRPALILMLAVLTLSLGSLRRFPPPPLIAAACGLTALRLAGGDRGCGRAAAGG